MKAASQQRSRSEAHSTALLVILVSLLAIPARAENPTNLILDRDQPLASGAYKGVVDLTVAPPFEGAKIALSMDGGRISDALTTPYRVSVDFGPRVVEHRITITAWSPDKKKRVQWQETVNRGHRSLSVKLQPVSGNTFQAMTTAADDDPITAVELWDNGKVVTTATKAPYRFEVPAEIVASGFVQVTARTKSGEEAADFWTKNSNVHAESLEVRNVPLFVSVVDRNGQTRDDVDRSLFRVLDNNSEGKIVEFGKAFDQPISIALLLDASASMNDSMDDAARAAMEFVDRTLKSGDRCTVFGIHEVPRQVQPLTDDKELVKKALAGMKASGETALFDAIDTAIRMLKDEKNRRAIVVLSDGGDNASMDSFEDIDKTATEAGIPVYFVTYDNFEPSSDSDMDRMKVLAAHTGGFVTESKQQTLAARYRQIEKDLRAQFAIIYQIADMAKHNEWRKVQVEIKSPKLTARTIGGYFAP